MVEITFKPEAANPVRKASCLCCAKAQEPEESRTVLRNLDAYRIVSHVEARCAEPRAADETADQKSGEVVPEMINDLVIQLKRERGN